MSSLAEDIKQRKPRALSRAISAAENRAPDIHEVLRELFPLTGRARVFGITGPPGAGKSSLTSRFVKRLRSAGKTVAVIAVDPMSPFSGGALLGDRVRLSDHFNDEGVFIRSLSTRGKLGGLSLATRQVLHLVDAYGFDFILVETVGVGQSELDVRDLADVTLVVLVPEAGDTIQAIKAGLLEIADVFAVHKAERPGADKLKAALEEMIAFGAKKTSVLLSRIDDETSCDRVLDALNGFFDSHPDLIQLRRREAVRSTMVEFVENEILSRARQWARDNVTTETNPYEFATKFIKSNSLAGLFK